ncbi:hypothetical protein GQ457_01G011280 [Hibiscus cannabinus]
MVGLNRLGPRPWVNGVRTGSGSTIGLEARVGLGWLTRPCQWPKRPATASSGWESTATTLKTVKTSKISLNGLDNDEQGLVSAPLDTGYLLVVTAQQTDHDGGRKLRWKQKGSRRSFDMVSTAFGSKARRVVAVARIYARNDQPDIIRKQQYLGSQKLYKGQRISLKKYKENLAQKSQPSQGEKLPTRATKRGLKQPRMGGTKLRSEAHSSFRRLLKPHDRTGQLNSRLDGAMMPRKTARMNDREHRGPELAHAQPDIGTIAEFTLMELDVYLRNTREMSTKEALVVAPMLRIGSISALIEETPDTRSTEINHRVPHLLLPDPEIRASDNMIGLSPDYYAPTSVTIMTEPRQQSRDNGDDHLAKHQDLNRQICEDQMEMLKNFHHKKKREKKKEEEETYVMLAEQDNLPDLFIFEEAGFILTFVALFRILHHRVRMDKSSSLGLAPSGSKDWGPWLNGQIITTDSASFDQSLISVWHHWPYFDLAPLGSNGQIAMAGSASFDHSPILICHHWVTRCLIITLFRIWYHWVRVTKPPWQTQHRLIMTKPPWQTQRRLTRVLLPICVIGYEWTGRFNRLSIVTTAGFALFDRDLILILYHRVRMSRIYF